MQKSQSAFHLKKNSFTAIHSLFISISTFTVHTFASFLSNCGHKICAAGNRIRVKFSLKSYRRKRWIGVKDVFLFVCLFTWRRVSERESDPMTVHHTKKWGCVLSSFIKLVFFFLVLLLFFDKREILQIDDDGRVCVFFLGYINHPSNSLFRHNISFKKKREKSSFFLNIMMY